LTPVTWKVREWPVFTNASGNMNSWHLGPESPLEDGEGSLVASSAHLDFPPGSNLSPEFVHWRFPVNGSYIVSPPGHPNSLQLASYLSNLMGAGGRSAEPKLQTFIARRQVHSVSTFSTTVPSFIFHDLAIVSLPAAWKNRITLKIRASNITHYTFSAGPVSSQSQKQDIGFAPGLGLTWDLQAGFPSVSIFF